MIASLQTRRNKILDLTATVPEASHSPDASSDCHLINRANEQNKRLEQPDRVSLFVVFSFFFLDGSSYICQCAVRRGTRRTCLFVWGYESRFGIFGLFSTTAPLLINRQAVCFDKVLAIKYNAECQNSISRTTTMKNSNVLARMWLIWSTGDTEISKLSSHAPVCWRINMSLRVLVNWTISFATKKIFTYIYTEISNYYCLLYLERFPTARGKYKICLVVVLLLLLPGCLAVL